MMQNYILGVVAVAAISNSNPTPADAIDGGWCHAASGKHLRIDGPAITTPGGNTNRGDYDRRGFRYIISAPEQPAGKAVTMSVIDDDKIQLIGGFAGGSVQDWQRCAQRNQPDALSENADALDAQGTAHLDRSFDGGTDSRDFGAMILGVIRNDWPYVIPHQEFEAAFRDKVEGILDIWGSDTPPLARIEGNELRKQAFQRLWER